MSPCCRSGPSSAWCTLTWAVLWANMTGTRCLRPTRSRGKHQSLGENHFGQNHEEPWYSVKVVPEIPLISFTQNISEVFDQKKNHQTISDPLQALQATWLHCSSSLMCCLDKCRLLAAEELVSATSLARAPSKHLGWVRNGGWSLP